MNFARLKSSIGSEKTYFMLRFMLSSDSPGRPIINRPLVLMPAFFMFLMVSAIMSRFTF